MVQFPAVSFLMKNVDSSMDWKQAARVCRALHVFSHSSLQAPEGRAVFLRQISLSGFRFQMPG
ncbi:hypothetical protein CXU05_05640 [Akkermansia muciniphila]|nr:hypothetical protein CXU05_05640 [Akkermansia muciniphila]